MASNLQKYFSPGRVNMIGEHIDYNGGYVFPCAISLGTFAQVANRADTKTCLYSMNLPEIGIAGVIAQGGHKAAHGFDIVIYGTLPVGAGLSSSASIELLTAVILNTEFTFGLAQIGLVKLSQRAENEFVGMNCGITFAVGMGSSARQVGEKSLPAHQRRI